MTQDKQLETFEFFTTEMKRAVMRKDTTPGRKQVLRLWAHKYPQ